MKSILIIDDEEAAIFAYSRYFSRKGYSVYTAGTIEEGRRKLGSYLDAVVLDLKLPDGTALDFIREIKGVHENATVVVASGISDQEVIRSALKMGAYQFLVKPLSMEEICQSLADMLECPPIGS